MKTLETLLDAKLLKGKTEKECDFIFDLRAAQESFVNEKNGALFIVYSKIEDNDKGNLVIISKGEYVDSTLYSSLIYLAQTNSQILPILTAALGRIIHDSEINKNDKQEIVNEMLNYFNKMCINE